MGHCYEDKSVSDCLAESDARIADFLVEDSVEQIRAVQLSVEEVTKKTTVHPKWDQGKVHVDDFQNRAHKAELYYCSDFSICLSTAKPWSQI